MFPWVSATGTPEARTVVILSMVFLVLALLSLVGRFYSRWLMGVSFALDDYLMIGGFVSCWITFETTGLLFLVLLLWTCDYYYAHGGWGRFRISYR